MNKPVGGRGIKAPYETTHMRIPVDLKPQIEKIVEQYRESQNPTIEPYLDESNPKLELLIERVLSIMAKRELLISFTNDDSTEHAKMNALADSLEDSIKLARKLIESRNTKKELATKLLTAIYGIEVIL